MKKPCCFLDRDGVLNEEVSYITHISQLKIYDFAKEAVKMLKDMGFVVIVITNQSAIARGMMTEEELKVINERLKEEIMVDQIYYCPHLNSAEEGVEPKYIVNCNCRKPSTELVFKATKEHNIDLTNEVILKEVCTALPNELQAALQDFL